MQSISAIVEMKIWRLLYASQKAEKQLAMASSYVCLTISTPELYFLISKVEVR
jgi:hypothetical protein